MGHRAPPSACLATLSSSSACPADTRRSRRRRQKTRGSPRRVGALVNLGIAAARHHDRQTGRRRMAPWWSPLSERAFRAFELNSSQPDGGIGLRHLTGKTLSGAFSAKGRRTDGGLRTPHLSNTAATEHTEPQALPPVISRSFALRKNRRH